MELAGVCGRDGRNLQELTGMSLVLLALPAWSVALFVALFFFICVVLILTVLIQRPQGGGLSGAFGSNAGSGQTAFGTKTGDALTIATIGMFVVYVLAAVGLNYAVRPSAMAATAPAAAATPAAPGTEGTPVEGEAKPAEGAAAPTGGMQPIKIEPVTPPATEPGTTPAATPGTEPAPAPVPAPVTPAPTPTPAPATPPATTPETPKP